MALDPGPGMDGKNMELGRDGWSTLRPGEAVPLLGAKFMDGIRTLVRCGLNLPMTGGCKG